MSEKTTAEFEIKVSSGRITKVQMIPDGSCKVTVELVTDATQNTYTIHDDIFVKVQASKLSLKDEFMKHKPKTKAERIFKRSVKKAIKNGLKDFYRPKYDPSFSEDGTNICYVPGKMPAIGNSYNWWEENAKKYAPECKSRLGTKNEYIAFLAVLIKELVASGKSVEWAWNAVCNDSKELGYYWSSKGSKHDFENTGNREICGFYDLANTYKILAKDGDEQFSGFWLACGSFVSGSYICGSLVSASYFRNSVEKPLANLLFYHYIAADNDYGLGWLVLESCHDC